MIELYYIDTNGRYTHKDAATLQFNESLIQKGNNQQKLLKIVSD